MTDGTSQPLDLREAAARVAALAAHVTDDQLAGPTPCPDLAVRHLLGHLLGLSAGLRDAARKDLGPSTSTAPNTARPDVDAEGAWRAELPRLLDDLAAAWQDPAAWTGTTQAGGVTLPGAVAGVVTLNELVVHGWDLARATGQPYGPGTAELEACRGMLAPSADDRPAGGPFAPAVPVPADVPLLDQVIGLSGRDPYWKP
jgi:uncharacterized protein (TIGR03086 family)